MKAKDIVSELEELERKRDEISTVLTEASFGEPALILQGALEKYQKRVDTFLDAEYEPLAVSVAITVTPTPIAFDVNDTAQLTVIATLSDGTTKDITPKDRPLMLFRDFDKLADNIGTVTKVDISGYLGQDITLEIVKTSTGFDVDNNLGTQGLEVATLGTNQYQVVDMTGAPIGVVFTTDGAEIVGDNWLIDIYIVNTGTKYTTDNPAVVGVSESGLVVGVGGGTANVIIENGLQQTSIPVTVGDMVPPSAPTIIDITGITEGADILFDPSPDLDVVSYNIYVDGVKAVTGVIYDGSVKTIPLIPADGVTSYSITMTALDGSGNESPQSVAEPVIPFA